MDPRVPIVLVHGAWHGSWCWSLVTEELASRGMSSVAIDVEGHGLRSPSPQARWKRPFDAPTFATEPSPTAATSASSAACALVAQLRRIGRGGSCVVVAHSMGGVVVSLAAEMAPELVAAIVYVAAFAPVGGPPAIAYVDAPENKGSIAPHFAADPTVIGALRFDTGDHSRHAGLREAFYNDVDRATADAAIALLTPDAPIGIAGEPLTVTRDNFGAIPHTYVLCTRDNAVRPDLQRRFVRELDAISTTATTVVELDASHSPFLSRPVDLGDTIEAACERIAGPRLEAG